MSTPSCVKQPGESRLYSFDFSALLATGETLSSVNSVTYVGDGDPADTALTLSGSSAIVGKTVTQRILAGTSGVRYKVTTRVTTSLGNILEGEGILQVKDL